MEKEKLRVGLLVNDYTIPFWAYKMIEDIQKSNHSEIKLIVRKQHKIKKKASFLNKIWEMRKEFLFFLYSKFEDKWFKLEPNAFEPKCLKDLIHCPEIKVSPKETKFSDRILDEDINKIKTHEIDVFIRLGFKILRGEILNSAKYGIWSYHHGDNKVNRGGPAGVWEVLEKCDVTGVMLQILTEELDGGTKLHESFWTTDYLSINRNKSNCHWKAKSFIPRKLQELYQLGEKEFFQKVNKANSQIFFYYNKLYTTPKNLQLFKKALSNYWKTVKIRIKEMFYFEQWILLFNLENTNKFSTSFFRFKRITPPKDRFWADPFIIQRDNKYYIFIEEFVYSENKGKISVIEMKESGEYQKPKVVLEKDYHLSYPFLFEENGELYMIPESQKNKTIDLYRCIEFPLIWDFKKTLINNIEAVDSTIFKYNNKYWLFTNVKEDSDIPTFDDLCLFYSDSLLVDEWKPHPRNPIISDVKYVRPAGNIFIYNDRIYRPAQNCSKHYGYGMQIRKITKLNENDYEEKKVQSIYPNWADDLISTHTLNNSGKLTVIDALIKRRK
jgi:hypothetical protein